MPAFETISGSRQFDCALCAPARQRTNIGRSFSHLSNLGLAAVALLITDIRGALGPQTISAKALCLGLLLRLLGLVLGFKERSSHYDSLAPAPECDHLRGRRLEYPLPLDADFRGMADMAGLAAGSMGTPVIVFP